MAWAATDNFESYSAGTLVGGNGGTGWSNTCSKAGAGSWVPTVQTSVVLEGTKSIACDVDTGSDGGVTRSFTGTTSGVMRIKLRRDTVSGNFYIFLRESTNSRCWYILDPSGNITHQGVTHTTYSANTTYTVDFEYDCSTDQSRIRIDGGTWGSWRAFASAATSLDNLYTNHADSATAINYFDAIGDGAATNITVSPSAQVVTASLPAPTYKHGSRVSPSAQTATFSLPARVISLGTTIAVAVQTATFSIPTYFIEAGNKLVQATVSTATFSIPAYTVAVVSNIAVAVNAVVATFSIPAVTIAKGTGVAVAAAVQVVTATIPAYTLSIQRSIIVTVNAVVATFSLPTLAKVGAIWRKIARSTNSDWTRVGRNST